MKGFGILMVITLVIVGLSLLLLGVQTFFLEEEEIPGHARRREQGLGQEGHILCADAGRPGAAERYVRGEGCS